VDKRVPEELANIEDTEDIVDTEDIEELQANNYILVLLEQ
jgi:hypothetical protein